MSRRAWAVALVLAGVVALVAFGARQRGGAALETAEAVVVSGPLEVWSTYSGRYESSSMQRIASALSGPAPLNWLAADGALVQRGEVIARLDTSTLEAGIAQKEEALATARGEAERLRNVSLPTEAQDLEVEIALAEDNAVQERNFLRDSEQLVRDGLLSAQELEQQQRKVRQEDSRLAALREKASRLKQYDRPARTGIAQARVRAAERELRDAREQLQKAVIRAPVTGAVILEPIQLGGEFRVVRAGDSVSPSQSFMLVTGTDGLQARFDLPESELQRVALGQPAAVQPLADLRFRGTGEVSYISATAQTAPGYPVWQRFFQVRVNLPEAAPAHVRPGGAAVISVQSFQRAQVLLVPRLAVEWADGAAFVQVREGADWSRRPIQVGVADPLRFEVLSGLAAGDVVRVLR